MTWLPTFWQLSRDYVFFDIRMSNGVLRWLDSRPINLLINFEKAILAEYISRLFVARWSNPFLYWYTCVTSTLAKKSSWMIFCFFFQRFPLSASLRWSPSPATAPSAWSTWRWRGWTRRTCRSWWGCTTCANTRGTRTRPGISKQFSFEENCFYSLHFQGCLLLGGAPAAAHCLQASNQIIIIFMIICTVYVDWHIHYFWEVAILYRYI